MLRNRLGYCVLLACAVLFHIFFVGYLSFFLLAFLLLLPLLSLALTVPAVGRTEIRLRPPAACPEKGGEAVFRILLRNRFFLPVPCAKVRLCSVNSLCGEPLRETLMFPVDARADAAVEYRLRSRYAGKISVSLTDVRYYDFLGIFSFAKKLDGRAETFVPPSVFPLDIRLRPVENAPDGRTYSAVKPGDDPSEVFDVRPYREGDRLRSVHWKLSARLGELMVREFGLPLDCAVVLLLELLAPGPDVLETVLETAASVSHFLVENRVPHRIEWYDARRREYRSEPVADDDAFAAAFAEILSAGGYRDRPYASVCRGSRETARSGSRLICVTGDLTRETASLCERTGGAAVLYACEGGRPAGKELTGALAAAGAEVVPVRVGEIGESLSGLTL